jgi:hypothetical protein
MTTKLSLFFKMKNLGIKWRKAESLKKAQHGKMLCCGLVGLSLFMGGTGKGKLPSKPPSTGLSIIQQTEND